MLVRHIWIPNSAIGIPPCQRVRKPLNLIEFYGGTVEWLAIIGNLYEGLRQWNKKCHMDIQDLPINNSRDIGMN